MGVFKLPSISSADRTSLVLSQREVVFDTDKNIIYYGDGTTSGGISLATGSGSLNISAGTTSNNLTALTLSNSNGVSFGLNGSVITASVAAGGNLNISAGTTSNNLTAVTFSNLNGISFGLNGSVVTGSHNALTSQSAQVFSADASSTFQTLVFQDSNGISFSNNLGSLRLTHGLQYTSNTSVITVNAVNTSDARIRAASAGTTILSTGTLKFADSNGISFGLNGSILTASVNAVGGAALKGSGTYTQNTGTVEFANSNGVTFGLSNNGTMTASHNGLTTARASNDGVGLNTAQTNVTWTVNSAGLSFNAAGYAGTGTSATNASITLNSNGLAISVASPAGGGAALKGSGTYTQNTGTIEFANSNGITFGLSNNGTMTASHNGLTTAMRSDAVTLSNVNVSAGTTSQNLSAFVFSNSNNFSFGLNGSTITGSYTVPSVTNSSFSVQDSATTINPVARIAFSTGNNITLSLSTGASSATVGVQHNLAGTSTGFGGGSISASMTHNSSGLNLSLSHPAWITTAMQSNAATISNINISGGTTSSNLSNFNLINSNGVSWSLDTGSKVYATVKTDYIQAISGVGTGGLGANFNGSGASLMQANGFSFILSNNSISGSYTVPSTAGLLSAINVSGGTTSSNLSALNFVNSNGVSWSLDTASKIYATVATNYQSQGAYLTTARASNDGVGLNTAQTNVTWTVNSSGLSLNASGYAGVGTSITGQASITQDSLGIKFNGSGLAGTGLTMNVTNLLVSSTLNSVGLNLSINNVDDHYKAFSLVGNTAGTNASTNTTIATFYLSGGNNITLSGNSNSIRIDGAAPGGTTFWTNSYYMWPFGAQYVGTSSVTMGNSSMYVQPFIVENPISASYIRHLVSMPAFGSSTQATTGNGTFTNDWYATFYANVFSMGVGANSQSLQLMSTATAGMTNRWIYTINAGSESVAWQITYPALGANTQNDGLSYSQTSANINWSTTGNQSKYTGMRWLDIPFTQSLAPGQYWMQFQRSTNSATTGGNMANSTGLTTNMTVINITQASIAVGPFGNTIGSTDGLQLGLGVYSTNSSGGTTNSMSFGGISTIANQPVIPFQIIRRA